MFYTFETGQLFRFDMDHAARSLPLVPPNRLFGIEVPQPAQLQGNYHPFARRLGLADPSDAAVGGAFLLCD